MMRIYFCGPSASGKTTLAEWVAHELSLPVVESAARRLQREYGATPDEVRRGGRFADLMHENIIRTQISLEQRFIAVKASFVSERCLDGVTYGIFQSSVARRVFTSPLFSWYTQQLCLPEAVVFLVQPMREAYEAAQAEGDRAAWLDWEEINQMYGSMLTLLQILGIPYHLLAPGPLLERVQKIRAVLRTPAHAVSAPPELEKTASTDGTKSSPNSTALKS